MCPLVSVSVVRVITLFRTFPDATKQLKSHTCSANPHAMVGAVGGDAGSRNDDYGQFPR